MSGVKMGEESIMGRELQQLMRITENSFKKRVFKDEDSFDYGLTDESTRAHAEAAASSVVRRVTADEDEISEALITDRLWILDQLLTETSIDSRYLKDVVDDATATGDGIRTDSVIGVLYRRTLLGWLMTRLPVDAHENRHDTQLPYSRSDVPPNVGNVDSEFDRIDRLVERVVAEVAWQGNIQDYQPNRQEEGIREVIDDVLTEYWNDIDDWVLTEHGYFLEYCVTEGVEATNIDLASRSDNSAKELVLQLSRKSLRRLVEKRIVDYLAVKTQAVVN